MRLSVDLEGRYTGYESIQDLSRTHAWKNYAIVAILASSFVSSHLANCICHDTDLVLTYCRYYAKVSNYDSVTKDF